MEVDKQLKFKSHDRMQVEFISNNVDVMTHDCLSSVALALLNRLTNLTNYILTKLKRYKSHTLYRFTNLPWPCLANPQNRTEIN